MVKIFHLEGKEGKKHCDFFSCKTFVDWPCKTRNLELLKRKFCLQCLSPGKKHTAPHFCSKKYICPDPSHKSFDKGLHVLVCEEHKGSAANIDVLKKYIKNFIEKRGTFHDFTRNISLTCIYSAVATDQALFENLDNVIPDVSDRAIFPLQTIDVEGLPLRVFYDRGAGDAVLKWAAVDALKKLGRAVLIQSGPISMSGVGGIESVTHCGLWSICLPLKNGHNVVITGVCMENVTAEFPSYELAEVEKDVRERCQLTGGATLLDQVPQLASQVGGETDILLGSKYLRIHPREVWKCEETGLSVADSLFSSVDGTTGVINGPHPKFTEIERQHWAKSSLGHNVSMSSFSYYTKSVIEYRAAYELSANTLVLGDDDSNLNLCGVKQKFDLEYNSNALTVRRPPKCIKTFDEIDTAGTDVSLGALTAEIVKIAKRVNV